MPNKFKYVDGGKCVKFKCPGCGDNHVIPIEGPGAWGWNGNLESPTLSPSILSRNGHYVPGWKKDEGCWCTFNADRPDNPSNFHCHACHSFVKDGKIQFLSDCTHELAGQTVEMYEVEEGNDG